MSIKDMYFEGHPAVHFDEVLDQGLNKLLIVFSLVIPKEATNHCNKAVPRYFFWPSELLEEFLALMIFFICGPTKTPALTFASDSLGKKPCR